MSDDTKLVENASQWWKMASNQIMIVAGTVFTIYLALPADQQQTIIDHLPLPPWTFPIIATVVGVIARLWKQTSINKGP